MSIIEKLIDLNMKPLFILGQIVVLAMLGTAALARPLIYDPHANPRDDLALATARAAQDDKLILLVFGADWCPDCQVLDYHFKQEGLRAVIDANFHVVKVDVGEKDKNLDFVAEFGNPIAKGIPAIAILDAGLGIQYVSNAGEFANSRSAKTDSLKDWFQSVVDKIRQNPGSE